MVAVPMLLAAVLGGIYLAFDPPSADLAAQTFRADFFDAHGFAVWSNSWYAGFHLPGYSLLYPPLGAWLGVRLVGVLSAVAAAGLFAALAQDRFGERARLGVLWFAVGVTTNLLTGRITFGLGVAIGLGALLALQRARPRLAAALAVLTSFASPVAGLFLALAGAAVAISRRPALAGHGAWLGGAGVAAGAAAGIAALVLAFPVEGIEPFAVSAFVNVPLFAIVALVLIPGDERTLRWGVGIYAVLGILVFAFDNAAGGNVTRLGALFAGPVMALALWGRRPVALAILALPLLWWQWAASVRDLNDAVGDPSVEASFYEPLLEELDTLTVGAPTRVEVPPTRNRWEAKYVGEAYPLARGWLRQAESDDTSLFKFDRLTPDAYLAWLRERAVGYVAVPQGVDRDYLADDEAALIEAGLPYLRAVWENDDWRLYEVRGEPAFVTSPGGSDDPAADARIASLGPTSFELTADAPGDYLVRLHYTRYWDVSSGDACLLREGDWTVVRARSAGVIRVEASFGLDALFGTRDDC
jgi:hypothetical protein